MTLNKRSDYGNYVFGQANKSQSIEKATSFVKEIINELSPFLESCENYNSKKKLGNAPAVELPNGNLVVAPDIICQTKSGHIFWVEAKDKSQRFYHPDTGADIFQVYGWFKVWSLFSQPVFVVFKDPDFSSCLPRNDMKEKKICDFKKRWDLFSGKPYGNWLNVLLGLKNNYPQIFLERTRQSEMYIFYFLVSLMQSSISWKKSIDDLDSGNIGDIQDEIRAYYNGQIVSELNIEAMIRECVS